MIGYAFKDFPEHAKAFYGKDGRALKAGERLIQVDLAGSLKKVAKGGSRVFYEGELATIIDTEMKAQGSFLSIDDL